MSIPLPGFTKSNKQLLVLKYISRRKMPFSHKLPSWKFHLIFLYQYNNCSQDTQKSRLHGDTQKILEKTFLHFSITMRPSPFCIMTENNSWQTILEQMPAVSHLFYNSNSNSSVALYWFGFCWFVVFLKQAIWIGPRISQSVISRTNWRQADPFGSTTCFGRNLT